MMNEKKEQIIEKYNSTAHFYDDRYSIIQAEKYDLVLKNFIFEGKIMLDAGCGTGLFHDYIQYNMYTNQNTRFIFLAMDISLKMLAQFHVKKKTGKLSHQDGIHLILSDMDNLPFRSEVFDSIFSLTALQNLPDIDEGVEDLFRVAKNNAEMILSILKKSLNSEALISGLKPRVQHLKVLNENHVEDIILFFTVQGKN